MLGFGDGDVAFTFTLSSQGTDDSLKKYNSSVWLLPTTAYSVSIGCPTLVAVTFVSLRSAPRRIILCLTVFCISYYGIVNMVHFTNVEQ